MYKPLLSAILLCAAIFCISSAAEAASRPEQVMAYFASDMESRRILCQTLANKWHGKYEFTAHADMNSHLDPDKEKNIASDMSRARSILQSLGKAAGENTDGWAIIMLDSDKINAFALPGYIFGISTKAFNTLTDAELEVLLAHELGHQILEHPVKAILYSSLARGKLRQAYHYLPEQDNDVQRMADYYAEALELSLISKRQERQADIWAADFLRQNGSDMQTAIGLWQKLEKLYGKVPNDSNHLSYHERQQIYHP